MTTVDHHRSLLLSDVSSILLPAASRTTRIAHIPPAAPSPPATREHQSPRRRKHSKIPESPKMALEDMGQWLFTDEEIANTPSIQDGLSITEERARRAKGVNFIVQAGVLLKLPQLTLATASVFFHRFYMRMSMAVENNNSALHHYNIAATALFLATKTEENCRKTKEIVIAVAKVAQKNASLIIDEQSKEYWRWRDSILLYEEAMLEQLTFDVCLQSPYNLLYDYIHALRLEENHPNFKGLRNAAWAFLNDSQMTIMCLRLKPAEIAVAAIYFAAKHTKETIDDGEGNVPWWQLINGKPDQVVKSVDIMSVFYTENPLKRSDNPYGGSPGSTTEADVLRTRHYFVPSTPGSDQGANGSAEHLLQSPVNGTNGETSQAVKKEEDPESGASDALLKAAANDPATHGRKAEVSYITVETLAERSTLQTAKRKSPADPRDEPATKMGKIEKNTTSRSSIKQNGTKLADRTAIAAKAEDAESGSEEGELEG
ncbi:cyclin-like protein [Calycina marina]|uniref:RNA polymerase II holoenzyme cyclin-like subunit n=1 Tax=Calycina marina TaxID=1763456 RepID=A0A9P7Z3G3_9HELO|nr:cyclin-like protein [Calycina marina]